jgi:hypothetical protein
MDLGKQAWLLRDVHQYILRPHHIEGGRGKGHVQGIPLPEGGPIVQADPGRQHVRGPTECFREIEADDPASKLGGEGAGWPPNPTADIQHVHAFA